VNSLALTTTGSGGAATGNITGATLTLNIPNYTAGSSFITSLTTTGTSGASNVSGGVLNIPNYSQTFSSLTTTGTSGAASLSGGVLNIPQYAGAVSSLTTTGTTGNASLSGGVLNVPNYTSPVQSISTSGTSGAATLSGGVLNIPQYTATGPIKCDVTIPAPGAIAAGACYPIRTNPPAQITSCAGFNSTAAVQMTAQGAYANTTGWSPVLTPVTPTVWADATSANTIDYYLCNNNSASVTPTSFAARFVINP
jgi:hypothetical protein